MTENKNRRSRTVIETILVVFLLTALLVAMYNVLQIFFGVLTFALVFAISFNDLFEWMVIKLKGRRKLVAAIYSILLISVLAVPLSFLFSSLARNAQPAIAWINDVKVNGLPPLPQSVGNIPLAGKEIAKLWSIYHDDPKQIISDHQDQVEAISKGAMTGGVTILGTVLDVIIGIIISALLLVNKFNIITAVRQPLEHLLGNESGDSLLDAIAMSIRGVSIGVMGTAFIAAIIAFIGLEIAGIHFALGLAAVVFFLVVIQIGPIPIWIPIVIYMATQNRPGMVVFLIIWGVIILVVDYIVKPVLIGRSGGKLPFLVLFLGVVGGLAAWGFTGMFKGAIILAVFYTVYNAWLGNKKVVVYESNGVIPSV